MKLLRLGAYRQEIPALEGEDGTIYDARQVAADYTPEFFDGDGLEKLRRAYDAGLPVLEGAADLRVGAPVARPGAVLCIGMNYAEHAAESGGSAPSEPVLFFKHPNTVVGPRDDVPLPRKSQKTDWEVELAVVIGRRASYLESVEDSAGYIAGYAVSNDVSERDFQLGDDAKQWGKGKSCANFNPLGPVLVTGDELGDPQKLRVWSSVNGDPRQDSNTKDMIFDVNYIVWYLSQYLVLEPGDVINTGTPQGVALSGRFPYLQRGDVMEIGIDGLGQQRQVIS